MSEKEAIERLKWHTPTFGNTSSEEVTIAIAALEKQIELSQMIADIKKDFNKEDTYSVSLVLELLKSVQIGEKKNV